MASKFDVLINNKMLETQIAQQATSSSTPPGRLPSKLKSNSCEQCNCVTLKKGIEDLEGITLEEGREVIMAESKEKNNEGKPITFRENDSFEIPKVFPFKLPDPGNFSIPCAVGKVTTERALCDLGASVCLLPYSMFHKLHLGTLRLARFSLQLVDGSKNTTFGYVRGCACKKRKFLGARRFYHC